MEADQQKQVVTWARWASKSGKYPMLEMLHCSLNGVKLSAIQASIAKAQGMLSGVPDLFLPVPKKVFETIKASNIQFDQLILEFNSWVHISFVKTGGRRECLVVDRFGTERIK